MSPATLHPQVGFSGKEMSIGDLLISGCRVDAGAWRRDLPSTTGRYIDVRYGLSRLVILTEGSTLPYVTPEDAQAKLLLITDEDVPAIPAALSKATLAAPSDASVLESEEGCPADAIRLYRDFPVAFQLRRAGITLPPASWRGSSRAWPPARAL